MPGNVNKAGANAGSLMQVTLIAAFGPIPTGQQAEITDFNAASANPSADTTVIVQMSKDNFVADIVEKDRFEMTVAGTFTRSYGAKTGNGRLIIPQGYKCRVVGVQGTAGVFSASLIGQTRKLVPDRSDDAPGDDILDL